LVILQWLKVIDWTIPASGARAERQARALSLILISILGGFAGSLSSIISIYSTSKWEGYLHPHSIQDGQSPMVIVFTLPICTLTGSILALCWARIIRRVPTDRLWASIFRYSGENRIGNCALAILFLLFYFALILAIGFFITWQILY